MTNAVHAEMLNRLRALEEQQFQNDTLHPLLFMLIGIADRCRDQEEALRRSLARARERGSKTQVQSLRYLISCRRGDRVEIEERLAGLGTQAFTHPGTEFDPTSQTCIQRCASRNGSIPGEIASRLRPGYQRNGRVLRPECVGVFVHSHDQH